MNCSRAREFMALAVGGDLPDSEDLNVHLHLQRCGECREWSDRLVRTHALLRSLRQEAVPASAITRMREGLQVRLDGAEARLGWRLRFERFLFQQWRRPRYAIAGVALAVLVTATLFTQLRHVAANPDAAVALVETREVLALPGDYRNWVFLGVSTSHVHTAGSEQKVYVSPWVFQEYRRTGKFPEGAVLVLESSDTAGRVAALSASVKDRGFDSGWGYFRFESAGGRLVEKATALPVAAGCVACHSEAGATDQVFTQFYPVLRDTSGVL